MSRELVELKSMDISMNLSIERLGSLLAFAEQSAKLLSSPPRSIAQHKGFNRFEDQMRGLPGLQLGSHADSEAWLRLNRLVEIKPPMPEDAMLAVWIDLPSTPEKEPSLKSDVTVREWLALGSMDNEPPTPDALELSLKAYKEVVWKKWATEEKERRKSIQLYSNLFTLFQQMQGNLIDTQLELVWGIGMAVCSDSDGEIKYPMITQLVEITLNEEDMSLEICPRGTHPRLETQAFEARGNHAVVSLGKVAKQFFEGIENTVNPFEPSTYESVLRSASTLLDGQGVYWPDQTSADDRSIPPSRDHLTITDTWVLFARPRSSSQFIQDIQRFGAKLDESLELPPALAAIVTEPSSVLEEDVLPPFRGMSFVEGSGTSSSNSHEKAHELYFPLPYNDEQVQIIQRLEVHDGVVVQGPPGTGKTHTIANVICHYLALGKRVLVTSMKDPALSVLRNKIPEEIRPLAISLLTSEAEGMKQFEFAINKIAAEIQQIDRSAYKRDIAHIEGQIEELHATIARADREIAQWANKNIAPFTMDGDSYRPEIAARWVAENQGEFDGLLDPITIADIHHPQMTDTDVIQLRAARLAVGDDLVYVGKRIPLVTAFPETQKLIQAHQSLLHNEELKRKEDEGLIPRLLNNEQTTLISAIHVVNKLSELLKIHDELKSVDGPWIDKLVIYLRKQHDSELTDYLADLIDEIETSLSARHKFITRPVSIPQGIDQDETFIDAVSNLTLGKSAFGIAGLLGKQEQKRTLSNIKIIGSSPQSAEDWEHVLDYMRRLQTDRTLLTRWNAIAAEIPLPSFDANPESILQAGHAISLYESISSYLSKESAIMRELSALLPTWSDVVRIPQNSALLHRWCRHEIFSQSTKHRI
ncbi:MAG: AAA domain-containing protein [Halothiobacillaceae bacterium]